MAKYADITPFYEWLDWLKKESNTQRPEYQTLMFYEIVDELDSLPEVVRCKDCKHYVAPQGTYVCDCFEGLNFATDNDFCSYGERKDND